MNLLITGPTYWETDALFRERFWLYLASAKHHGIPAESMRFYGIGNTHYYGGAEMRIYGLVEFLKTQTDFTHVLFSHLWDVLFCGPVEEIIEKYERLGSPPMLMGAAQLETFDIHPPEINRYDPIFDYSQIYPYPGWSMYIAEIPYVIDRFGQMEKGHHADTFPLFYALESGLLDPEYDRQCEVFQTLTKKTAEVSVVDGRLYNSLTGTNPAMAHFLIADAEHDIGKDRAIMPWAERMGII